MGYFVNTISLQDPSSGLSVAEYLIQAATDSLSVPLGE